MPWPMINMQTQKFKILSNQKEIKQYEQSQWFKLCSLFSEVIYSHYIFFVHMQVSEEALYTAFHMLSTMEHQLYRKFSSQIFCFITQSHWG